MAEQSFHKHLPDNEGPLKRGAIFPRPVKPPRSPRKEGLSHTPMPTGKLTHGATKGHHPTQRHTWHRAGGSAVLGLVL